MIRKQSNAGARQSRALQAQLHNLFYKSCCINSSTATHASSVRVSAGGKPFTHSVINFYHLSDVSQPTEAATRHKTAIQDKGWDIRGRIYISYQGINAQFSGPWQDALAYTEWVLSQPEFKGLTWREYPVPKHMFPKLRLKFRPNLISLQGGMEDLPVTGELMSHLSTIPCSTRNTCVHAYTTSQTLPPVPTSIGAECS
jgi:hypothetical protein